MTPESVELLTEIARLDNVNGHTVAGIDGICDRVGAMLWPSCGLDATSLEPRRRVGFPAA